jgi:hypothetical protein
MGMGPIRRRRPPDVYADTGDMGDLADTAAPVGTEGLDATAGMPPGPGGGMPPTVPAGSEQAAALGPVEGGQMGAPGPGMEAPPSSGPEFGSQLAAGVLNPGDFANIDMDDEELAAQQMGSVLDNQDANPEERADVLRQLGLAARRRLAGL